VWAWQLPFSAPLLVGGQFVVGFFFPILLTLNTICPTLLLLLLLPQVASATATTSDYVHATLPLTCTTLLLLLSD